VRALSMEEILRVLAYCGTFTAFIVTRFGIALALGFVSYLVGAKLTRWFRYASLLEKLAFSTALGIGTLAMLVFILGSVGLLRPIVLLIVALAVIAVSFPKRQGWEHELYSRIQRVRQLSKRQITIGVLALLGVVVVFGPLLLLSLYPPTAWDSTSYHLPIAKLYVKSQGLVVAQFLRYPLFPQLGEMLFTVALIFSDAVSAQLTQLAMLVVLLAGCVAFCERFFSRRCGLWAGAMIMSYPLIVWSASVAYIDVTLMTFVFFSIYAFEIAIRENDKKWFILCGTFAGFAAGTKYTALFFAGIIGLLLIIDAFQKKTVRGVVVYALSFLLVASPWYVRNLVIARNPVWPFLSDVFGYWLWNPDDLRRQMQDLTYAHVVGRSVIDFLRLPYDLAMRISLYHSEAPFSPLFLALPLGFLRINHPTIRRLLLIAFSFLGFWFFTTQIPRYLLPALPLFCVPTAWALDLMLARIRLWGKKGELLVRPLFALICVALFASPGWIYAVERLKELGPVPVSPQQQDAFLASRLPTYKAYAFLNSLKGSNYVLYALYDENMAFFAKGVFMGDHFGVARYSDVLTPDVNGKVLYERLRQLGANYLLVNLIRVPIRFPLPDNWFKEHFIVRFADAHVVVYELTEEPVKLVESSELLENPSFEELHESVPIAWGIAGNPLVVSSRPRTGKLAAKCFGATNIFFQRVPVEEGAVYILRQYVRADIEGQKARLQINWLDQESRFLTTSIRVVEVYSEWTQYEMWVTAPYNATQAQVYASPHEDSVVYFDDFSFVRVTYGR